MVPRLAADGSSFAGAFFYYAHDKGARTAARVAWTQTVNLMTDCVEKAWKVMAYTAKHAASLKRASGKARAGDAVEKPVVAYSLSWHPEQKPDKATMLEAAKTSIEKLGLVEHEAVIIAHRDEPQPHCHVIVNRIHPITGMAANLYRSKRKLQDWAREYQKKEGTMYCPQREENHRKREAGRKTRYANPAIVEAWQNSHDARSFVERLEAKGYELAQGRKRLVLVDPYGKSSNPTRDLKAALGDGFKEQDFRDRMAGIDSTSLPTPEAIKERRTAEAERRKEREQAFEAKAAELIGKQADKHREERTGLSDRHQQRMDRKRTELEKFYRIDEQQARIGQLQDQLRNPGIVQRLGFMFFRTDRKIERTLREAEMQQADAVKRMNEALGALKKERERDLDRLDRRQNREAEALLKRLEHWRPTEHSRPGRGNDLARETGIEQDGPGLSR